MHILSGKGSIQVARPLGNTARNQLDRQTLFTTGSSEVEIVPCKEKLRIANQPPSRLCLPWRLCQPRCEQREGGQSPGIQGLGEHSVSSRSWAWDLDRSDQRAARAERTLTSCSKPRPEWLTPYGQHLIYSLNEELFLKPDDRSHNFWALITPL